MSAVVGELFLQSGLGIVISGLLIFIVGWIAFQMIVGRRD